jgi:hypothetical protein
VAVPGIGPRRSWVGASGTGGRVAARSGRDLELCAVGIGVLSVPLTERPYGCAQECRARVGSHPVQVATNGTLISGGCSA